MTSIIKLSRKLEQKRIVKQSQLQMRIDWSYSNKLKSEKCLIDIIWKEVKRIY